MILGIGCDIVKTSRIERVLKRHSIQFIDKILTKTEKEYFFKSNQLNSYITGRWAAKEAFAKALGTGFGENCKWLDIQIENDLLGKPFVTLLGETAKYFKMRQIQNIHLTISHEKEYAIAMVIFEK